MRVKRAKGWVCGCCHNIFRDNEKEDAEKCCSCIKCGGRSDTMSGSDSICKKCRHIDELKRAEETLVEVHQRVELLHNGL